LLNNYVLAATLTVLWRGFIYSLSDINLYRASGWTNELVVIQFIGLGIVVLSSRTIDTPAFLNLSAKIDEQNTFVEHRIYRYMPYPMYSGVMLAIHLNYAD